MGLLTNKLLKGTVTLESDNNFIDGIILTMKCMKHFDDNIYDVD